jgi:hypothetical protein
LIPNYVLDFSTTSQYPVARWSWGKVGLVVSKFVLQEGEGIVVMKGVRRVLLG